MTAVVSVWPKPSRMVIPQAARTRSMTSGFSGSPALVHSRRARGRGPSADKRSIRHTVGGAHSVVTAARSKSKRVAAAEKRALGWLSTVAPAFHGANTQLQACLAQPGELML